MSIVSVTWTVPDDGGFDPRHYTVQLLQNGSVIESKSIDSTSDLLEATFTVVVKSNLDLFAKIITVSMCNDESSGVLSKAVFNGGRLRSSDVFFPIV